MHLSDRCRTRTLSWVRAHNDVPAIIRLRVPWAGWTWPGPNFTWPLLMFASAFPETLMGRMNKVYLGRPLSIKTRKALLASVRPSQRVFLRADTGDVPEVDVPVPAAV